MWGAGVEGPEAVTWPQGPLEQLHFLIGNRRHRGPSRLGMRDGHSGPAKVRANFEDSPVLPPAGR